MSFVLVSPSTESWFQVRTVAARSSPWRVAGLTAASVRTTASIVAIRGWIIPTPLAMPETVTGRGRPVGAGQVDASRSPPWSPSRSSAAPRPPRGGRVVGGREAGGGQVDDPDGDLVHREPRPDDARREAQDAQRVDAEVDGDGLGDRDLVGQPGEAGRGVGAAARRHDRPAPARSGRCRRRGPRGG